MLSNGEPWYGLESALAYAEAELATARGQDGDADRHFATAVRVAQACGLPWSESDALHSWGRTLLERGDRPAAIEKLDAALEIYQRMKAGAPWLERVLEDKLRAQGTQSGDVNRSIDVVAARVDAARPDMATHAAPDGTVTLAFSDMEGFTVMTERLGDQKAHEVVKRHNRIVRQELAIHDGYEVELQGDGFLLAFGSARTGLLFAIALQKALKKDAERHPDEPIRVRIGLHTGEAIRDRDKFFGRTVILTARIAAEAKGGEILVSSLLRELTESSSDIRFGSEREVELKGISREQRLHEVLWLDH
jgi:class 3 adenylate cyclase